MTAMNPEMTRAKNRKSAVAARLASRTGFTILELLIAVIIIGILVAIIVPVYVSRANEARLTAAYADMDAITTAEQHAAIDTGYLYRLYVLDDLRRGPVSSNDTDNIAPNLDSDGLDSLYDERLRTDAGTDPTKFFIDTINGTVINTPFQRVRQDSSSAIGTETFGFQGPYLNYSRKAPRTPTVGAPPADDPNIVNGMPIDPWGQPYMLFTIKGYMKETIGAASGTLGSNIGDIVETDNFDVANSLPPPPGYDCTIFDRPTLVSFGPNNVPGDGSGNGSPTGQIGKGDDLVKQF